MCFGIVQSASIDALTPASMGWSFPLSLDVNWDGLKDAVNHVSLSGSPLVHSIPMLHPGLTTSLCRLDTTVTNC